MVSATDQRDVSRGEWQCIELLRNWAVFGLVVAVGLLSGCPFARPPATCSADTDCDSDGAPHCMIEGNARGVCVACATDAHCDNGIFCDGDESCVENECAAGRPPCGPSEDLCGEDADVCISPCTMSEDCDDGLFCNGDEVCDSDGRCKDGVEPCAAAEACFDGTGCVECVTSLDCADDEECIEFACRTVVPELSVSIEGCPDEVTSGDRFILTAIATGGSGEPTFTWTASGSVEITGDADADPDVVTVEVTAIGDSIEVVATVGDADASADGSASTTCSPTNLDSTLPLPDPVPDQSTNVPLVAGEAIVFSEANVPLLSSNASDPDAPGGDSVFYEWTVVGTPDAVLQPLETVMILQPSSPGDGVISVDVRIEPAGVDTTLLRLHKDGSTESVANVVLPGAYSFHVEVTNTSGQLLADTGSRTVVPRWQPQVSAEGDFAGLAATGAIYTTVLPPNTTANLAYSSLSRVAGTIEYTSVDDDATATADLASVDVVAGDAIVSIMPPFVASPVGTYSVNAGLNAGQVSIASASTGVRVLVGENLASATANTTLNIAALSELGRPRSNGTIRYAGVTHDAVGTVGDTAEALRGQNILFAEIKNDGREYVIVWGADDAGGAYDANDVRIYKPLTNQAGNANTFGLEVANFTLLEILDTGAPVTDCAVGALRGNATTPELVICHAGATGPVVKVYLNNGATGADDKVYSVRADQSTAPLISTITLDYTNAGTGAPTIALARFSEVTHDDLIVGDPFFDNGADGFVDGRVVILQGGATSAIPQPGFSVSAGGSFENLPANMWGSYTGIAVDGDDELFFGFSLATAAFTVASLDDVYVGAPGNDAATANGVSVPGSVFRIPGGTALDSTDATTNALAVSWSGEANGDQFGFRMDTTSTGRVIIAAIQSGHTPDNADGEGKVYIFSPSTANGTSAATIASVRGEQSGDVFGARLATGAFEGVGMLVAASPTGSYLKLIPTGGTLANPIAPMTRVQLNAIDTASVIVIGDLNGDGKGDIVVSRSDSDDVTAVWGRQ